MSRISECFEQLGPRKALIPYITAGDPDPKLTLELMLHLVENGADIIELGVPFSDPMADGPVIQKASERALRSGVTLLQVLDIVKQFRQRDDRTPVVLMGYLNPIEVMGYEDFSKQAAAAGVDGVLTVDMPPEEAEQYLSCLQQYKLDSIFLIAPTSDVERIKTICQNSSGYVYYVSVKGVTGAANLDTVAVKDKVKQIRENTDLPVGVGFGIKDAASAAQISAFADGVVVGSAIVKIIENFSGQMDKMKLHLGDLLTGMRRAMDDQKA